MPQLKLIKISPDLATARLQSQVSAMRWPI